MSKETFFGIILCLVAAAGCIIYFTVADGIVKDICFLAEISCVILGEVLDYTRSRNGLVMAAMAIGGAGTGFMIVRMIIEHM